MPSHQYYEYTIVVDALRAPGGGFYSVYSIYKDTRPAMPSQFWLVHQECSDAGIICISVEQAKSVAEQRAHAFIDRQAN